VIGVGHGIGVARDRNIAWTSEVAARLLSTRFINHRPRLDWSPPSVGTMRAIEQRLYAGIARCGKLTIGLTGWGSPSNASNLFIWHRAVQRRKWPTRR
jgi:hypothetical protein